MAIVFSTGGHYEMRNRDIRRLLSVVSIASAVAGLPVGGSSTSSRTISSPPVTSPQNTAQYKIDASQSKFMVKAFAGGLLSAFAHDHNIAIRDFNGVATFTYGTVSPASLSLTVRAESLSITDKVSASDRTKIEQTMRDEVLEVSKYPEIVFKGTRVEASKTSDAEFQAKILGEITLHGVTKSASIPVQLVFGNSSLRAQGSFALKQSDYGIKPVSVAGGTIKVKDVLKVTLDIMAHP
jgi:polyisoprenoid-binding protein YceI